MGREGIGANMEESVTRTVADSATKEYLDVPKLALVGVVKGSNDQPSPVRL